jgi:hypothetical protein
VRGPDGVAGPALGRIGWAPASASGTGSRNGAPCRPEVQGPALVAQRIRASDYGSEGCRFDSCRAHQKAQVRALLISALDQESGP